MVSSHSFVIGWIEFAVATTILFAATKLLADRLRQPVDRVNVIAMSFIAIVFVPLLPSVMSVPSLRLGLFSKDGERIARIQTTSGSSIPRQPLETTDASMLWTGQQVHGDAPDRAKRDVQSQSTTATTQVDTASLASFPNTSAPTGQTSNPFSWWSIAATILLLSHGLAMGWFILQWTIGTVRLRSILRKALKPDHAVLNAWKRVSDGRASSARLLVSTEIVVPMVFGWRRPVVLIPEAIATGDQSALQFCLTHEWSHVSRGDLPRWQLSNLCQFLFWYQPLFWMLRRDLRICQDLVADDLAAGAFDNESGRVEYSALLMSIATQAMSARIAGTMAFFDRSSQLQRRIKTLLSNGPSLRSRSTQAFYWLSGLSLLMVTLLASSVRLSAAHTQEGSQDQPAANQTGATNQSKNAKAQTPNERRMKVVRGRIVDEAGNPVVGARLWLPLQYQPRRTVQTTADDAGNFELKFPAHWISPRVSGSSWTVWAYAFGHSIQSQSVYEVIRGKSEKEYTIQLPPASNTRFRVLTLGGEPLPDVLVQPQNYRTSVGFDAVPEEMQPVVSARTDTNGLVTLPAIEPGLLFRLEMANEEFGRQSIRTDFNSDVPEREIRLRPTATIKGQLVGEKPEWVRGVKLSFTTDNQDEARDPHGIAEVVTDEEGRFEVPVIASGGPLRTYVSLDPKLPVRPRLRDGLYLTAGETMQLEIPLVPAPLAHGKVVAKSTGKPVPNAEISLGYGGFRQSDRVTTDESGKYMGRVLPGDVRIHIIVLPDGFVQLGAPWAEPHQVPANVDEFELPTIEVVGTREVTGRLIDANDQPLPNTQVLAVKGNRRYGFGKSDAEGRFKMRVPEGVETKIQVYLERRGSVPVAVVQQAPLIVRYVADVREKEMETARASKPDVELTGRVLIAGEPVGGVPVLLKRGVPVFRGAGEPKATRYSQVSETKTDADGKYRLSGLKAGDRYQVEIRPPFPAADPTWHYQSPYIQDLPDDAENEVALPDVKLLKLTQSIAGVVVDPDGNPVEGATVSVRLRSGEHLNRMTESGPPPWTKSDHLGRFQLKQLPNRPLSIMAYFANPKGGRIRFPAIRNVEMNQQDIRIVLDPSLLEEETQ
jgi:beta-lactamase regulating signal transducer with metallopeptidase domain